MPREGYDDNVRTKQHAEALAVYILERSQLHDNDGWPTCGLPPVLPSARDMIVKALREFAKTLPEN